MRVSTRVDEGVEDVGDGPEGGQRRASGADRDRLQRGGSKLQLLKRVAVWDAVWLGS